MTTKEETIELGIKAQEAKDVFQMHCMLNTKTDPVEREAQTRAFETARANMHEAGNRHSAALRQLG